MVFTVPSQTIRIPHPFLHVYIRQCNESQFYRNTSIAYRIKLYQRIAVLLADLCPYRYIQLIPGVGHDRGEFLRQGVVVDLQILGAVIRVTDIGDDRRAVAFPAEWLIDKGVTLIGRDILLFKVSIRHIDPARRFVSSELDFFIVVFDQNDPVGVHPPDNSICVVFVIGDVFK